MTCDLTLGVPFAVCATGVSAQPGRPANPEFQYGEPPEVGLCTERGSDLNRMLDGVHDRVVTMPTSWFESLQSCESREEKFGLRVILLIGCVHSSVAVLCS